MGLSFAQSADSVIALIELEYTAAAAVQGWHWVMQALQYDL